MTGAIRFLLGDEPRKVAGLDPNLTVLRYLREQEGLCGTKEGCAEGDCGACTVVLGEEVDGRLRHRAVNACIQFLPTLQGKQLIAVEHLKAADGSLHPVQQALVESHGSQCGFCTPGFVMSLFALYRDGGARDRGVIDDALAGNLCRCTGYGPIVAAARCMGAGDDGDEAAVLAQLASFDDGEALALEGGYFAPRTADDLAARLLAYPEATILAGGTDVGLWVTKQHRRLEPIVYVGAVAELRRLEVTAERIEIGAAVTYSEAHRAIAEAYPDFGEVIRRLGSRQIRNLGTIGGNIANGSPIGDSPPPLIALDARLVLRRGDARREIALEDFFIAYGQQDLEPGEFVETVILPRQASDWRFRCYKVSKRFDQDITAVLGAFNLKLEGGRVAAARICYGGMAATPKRASACEAVLTGAPWSEATLSRARDALAQDFAPIGDMRASAAYRLQVARNLLTKVYVETSEPATATRLVGDRQVAYG